MNHRVLGATGMHVSTICLGAMMFGQMGNRDHDDSVRVIRAALDSGINFVDTADVYSGGESERIVGKALRGRRDDVVLATKFGLPMGDDPNRRGGSARWIRRAVDDSLRRLGTDWIDLYQLHRPDHETDIDETLSALSDLVRAGKIRAIGSSTFPAELMVEAQWAAARGGHHRFTTEQPLYSILTRSNENAVLPTAGRHHMGVLTYSPLNAGWLSGRAGNPLDSHRASSRPTMYDTTIPANKAKADAVTRLTEIAADAGLPLPFLALGFVLAHPAVTSVIIGPRTHEQLTSLLPAGDLELSADILDRIDEVVPPGVDVNPADNYNAAAPPITEPRLRRRAHGWPSGQAEPPSGIGAESP